MWRTAAIFAAVIFVGGAYETWAVWIESKHPGLTLTITGLTKRYTHFAIPTILFLGTVLGYVLRSAGP